MVLSAPIPLEIIDVIMYDVSGHQYSSRFPLDIDPERDLRSCSLVSRSFLACARRWLFKHIILDEPASCRAMHRLLCSNQEIAPLIKGLLISIPTWVYEEQPPGSEYGWPLDGKQWVFDEETLPGVLSMLSHLRFFELYANGTLDWCAQFTTATHDAISNLFSLPTLTSIHLSDVLNIPFTIFRNSAALKELALWDCQFQIRDSCGSLALGNLASQIVGRLERLVVRDNAFNVEEPVNGRLIIEALTYPASMFTVSHLRELRFEGKIDDLLDIASWALRAASETLVFLVWEFSDTLIGVSNLLSLEIETVI